MSLITDFTGEKFFFNDSQVTRAYRGVILLVQN